MPGHGPPPKDLAQSAADEAASLSSEDQTRSDADQTGGDLDQTTADADQSFSERDQRASDRDQEAADIDQAASERPDADVDADQDRLATHARTRRTRSETAIERDVVSESRSKAARIRQTTALRRDSDADARDEAAQARDQLAAILDAEIDPLHNGDGKPGDGALPAHQRLWRYRQQAAAGRARAAAQRAAAARDRELAREDRAHAAADRRAAERELAAEGVDHLTGALRRRAGFLAVERELDRTRRTGEPLVLGFVDVNGLKAVNDESGHGAGDDLLAAVCDCIKRALRPYDLIVRVGGDEFVCALSGQSLAGVYERFERIAAEIASAREGAAISVGFAQGKPGEPVEELVARADAAMLGLRRGR